VKHRARLIGVVGCAVIVLAASFGWRSRQKTRLHEQIADADRKIRDEQYIEALVSAQEAIANDDENADAHYYLALALYKQRVFGSAQTSIGRAVVLAPESPPVLKLQAAIEAAVEMARHAELGEQALRRDLPVLAAREFELAFNAVPSEHELGLRAAGLLTDRGETLTAIKLINRIESQGPDEEALSKLSVLRLKLRPALTREFVVSIAEGWNRLGESRTTDARVAFETAVESRTAVDGEEYNLTAPFAGLIACSALEANAPQTQEAVRRAVRAGLEIDLDLLSLDWWGPVRADSELLAYFEAAFGAQLARGLHAGAIDSSVEGVELLWLPGGIYAQGCAPNDRTCNEDEEATDEFRLDDFYMMSAEVSNAEYSRCVEKGQCEPPECEYGEPEAPVVCVSTAMATAFCTGHHMRLPTASEWEYAARAGRAVRFPWGDDLPTSERARYAARSPVEVRALPSGQSRWGLWNMAGNVWEIVTFGESFEIRGGGFRSRAADLRSSIRNAMSASGRDDIGFRCAR